ncbi:galactoside alpha-(1,2)-fucosyltransferase 2-like isoform X1 [Mytilus californianus]|uniref:galactoside alpha-(1,2)-fucosyltransferase 2-like isoform X1 n=1 Tax=Mytilus californianus TaxID=6549 RepID=UPI002247D4D1|nr:galactoside alpha-(1,2)-fucosyltransferase 2-like isoform X1 [Mytilus californianus]
MAGAIKWKIRNVILGVLAGSICLYTYFYFTRCALILWRDWLGMNRQKFLCIDFHGGMANQMFMYAFGLSMSMQRNLQYIVPKGMMLTEIFNIKPNTFKDYGYHSGSCFCTHRKEDTLDCGYDSSFEKLPSEDLSFLGYFQSWKYWIQYENDVRKAFTFKPWISEMADKQIRNIMTKRNVSYNDGITLVGVHVRNGDYSKKHFAKFGYKLAPASYLKNALDFFRNRFDKVLFIVCTNDLNWTSQIIGKEKDIYLTPAGNPASVDMALLSLTNHTVMTVGTYGWFIAWLTRGITIHYKYPYVNGSGFSKQFHSNYSDHFYPGWIAME